MRGLRFGTITGTDRDGGFDFHGKAFVHWELKYLNPRLPRGQELYIERLNDTLENSVPSIYLVAVHEVHDPSIDIPTANCKIVRYRRYKRWNYPEHDTTIRELVSSFLQEIEPNTIPEPVKETTSLEQSKHYSPLDEAMFSGLPKLKQKEEVF